MTLEQLQEIITAIQAGNTAMANLKNFVNTCHNGLMPLQIAEQVIDTVSWTEPLSTVLNKMAKDSVLSKALRIVESAGYEVKAPQR